jgi:hypothetical protein
MLNSSNRVQKHRQSLRASGYRQVQIWVPDIRRKEFLEKCAKQVAAVNASDSQDQQINLMMETALNDLARSGEWN